MVPVRRGGAEVTEVFCTKRGGAVRALVFGAGKKFRPRNRYDHETDDSKSYLLGITMAFQRHRFWLSFMNTTRHS